VDTDNNKDDDDDDDDRNVSVSVSVNNDVHEENANEINKVKNDDC
jgi:hypothetical protein